MSPTGGNLQGPPKFQGPTSPAPQNVGDWLSFFRWLISLWQVANNSIGAQESITIAPQANAGNNESETLGAAQAFAQAHPPIPRVQIPQGAPHYPPQPQKRADELNAVTALALFKTPYPQRAGGGYVLVGTRATRLGLDPVAYAQYEFYETDSTLIYISNGTNWLWVAGVYARTQSQLSTLAGALTTSDTGLRVNVTDYAHMLMWSGSAWLWAPEDDKRAGEGPIMREIDPAPTTGWHIYDGSTVAYLKADGTTANVTLPNLTSTACYAKLGTPNSGPNAPTAPGAAASGTGSIGTSTTGITNPADTGTATTGITNPAFTANASTGITVGTNTTSYDVLQGVGIGHFVADDGHTHAVSDPQHDHAVGSPSDPGHQHTIGAPADPGHTHSLTLSGLTVTVDTTGQPENLVRRPWFRQ